MKSYLALLAFTGATFALPTASDPPLRILPNFWNYNLTSFRGPGCPTKSDGPYETRTTFGANTVDGSEIYYWYVAYPYMRASVDADNKEASVWCETTLKYTELDSTGTKPQADYRLRLHKNGTSMIADTNLEEGVTAKWTFTYYIEDDDDIVDTITTVGPYKSDYNVNSVVPKNSKPIPVRKCGTATIRFRTELSLVSRKKGGKGSVASSVYTDASGTHYYGTQQGFSYDWEKCAK